MIYFSNSIDYKHINYINEAIKILASININLNQTIIFDVKKLKNNCLGMTSKDGNKYIIELNNELLKEKDNFINTTIHEIIHVITDLKGANSGHGKDFKKIADYVTQKTKYIILRYAYKNLPVIKSINSFSNLDEVNQIKKLDEMMKNNDRELKFNFSSIYFTLKNENLKNKLTIHYIEFYYLPSIDISTSIIEFPYYAFNNKCRRVIFNNYINGKYDMILDTIKKTYRFDSLFSLKKEYVKVIEYSNRRFCYKVKLDEL